MELHQGLKRNYAYIIKLKKKPYKIPMNFIN